MRKKREKRKLDILKINMIKGETTSPVSRKQSWERYSISQLDMWRKWRKKV